jgi:GT2 family glycosyltransferase
LECLDALAAQEYPMHRQEVVVVADGCTDGTDTALVGRDYPFRLNVISQPQAGAGVARNRGVTAARGSLLLFLDDDVIANGRLVEAHAQAHTQSDHLVAIGPYYLNEPRAGDYLADQLYHYWIRLFGRLDNPAYQIHAGDVVAGNLSMSATTFAAAGGFDTEISGALEDHEFGIRLLQSGAHFVFLPDAKARHLETTDLKRSLQRNRRAGRAAVRMVNLHPTTLRSTKLFRQKTVMQKLVFHAPSFGRALAIGLDWTLMLSEKLRLKGVWLRLFDQARTYWYWRGVAEVFESEQRFTDWRNMAASRLGELQGDESS